MLDLRSQARKLTSRLSESFTLKEAEKRAKLYTAEQQARLAFLHEAAVERLRAARDLRDATRIGAAAAVYRESLLILSRALLYAWDPGRAVDDLSPASAWQELERRLLSPQPDAAFSDEHGRRAQAFREAQALAVERDLLAFDRLAPVEALSRLDLVHETAIRLLEPIEPRSGEAIRRSRVARLSAAGAGTLAVLGLVVAWAVAPKNVAVGKPAHASEYFPGSASADTLVNGEVESPFGSATPRASGAWFSIDLLSEHAIGKVVIYNRSDPFGRETTPFIVELSGDGKSFREVARLADESVPGQRWSVELQGQVARYVRLIKPDTRGLALSEIEVYGSKR
jgi:hypothetical protein